MQEIDADGQTFDPSQHEAVSQAPGEENKVIAVVQKGYRLGDRVIRPAMVVVGHGAAQQSEKRRQRGCENRPDGRHEARSTTNTSATQRSS